MVIMYDDHRCWSYVIIICVCKGHMHRPGLNKLSYSSTVAAWVKWQLPCMTCRAHVQRHGPLAKVFPGGRRTPRSRRGLPAPQERGSDSKRIARAASHQGSTPNTPPHLQNPAFRFKSSGLHPPRRSGIIIMCPKWGSWHRQALRPGRTCSTLLPNS